MKAYAFHHWTGLLAFNVSGIPIVGTQETPVDRTIWNAMSYRLSGLPLPPHSYVEAITPRVTVCGNGPLREVKRGHNNEPLIPQN